MVAAAPLSLSGGPPMPWPLWKPFAASALYQENGTADSYRLTQ
jgi:hypothetical protein